MMRLQRAFRAACAWLVGGTLAACSPFQGAAYPTFAGEGGNVQSIELLWSDGTPMGAFLTETYPMVGANANAKYRVRLIFDSGFSATVVQDGSVPLHVGERGTVVGGKVVPRQINPSETDRDLAHF